MKLLAPYLSSLVATVSIRETPAALDYSQRSCTELTYTNFGPNEMRELGFDLGV